MKKNKILADQIRHTRQELQTDLQRFIYQAQEEIDNLNKGVEVDCFVAHLLLDLNFLISKYNLLKSLEESSV